MEVNINKASTSGKDQVLLWFGLPNVSWTPTTRLVRPVEPHTVWATIKSHDSERAGTFAVESKVCKRASILTTSKPPALHRFCMHPFDQASVACMNRQGRSSWHQLQPYESSMKAVDEKTMIGQNFSDVDPFKYLIFLQIDCVDHRTDVNDLTL